MNRHFALLRENSAIAKALSQVYRLNKKVFFFATKTKNCQVQLESDSTIFYPVTGCYYMFKIEAHNCHNFANIALSGCFFILEINFLEAAKKHINVSCFSHNV